MSHMSSASSLRRPTPIDAGFSRLAPRIELLESTIAGPLSYHLPMKYRGPTPWRPGRTYQE